MTIEWIRDAELPEEILAQMERAASGAPACEGIHVPCSITVRLCDDETIRKINAECRGIDRSTDVLSFPTVAYPAGQTASSYTVTPFLPLKADTTVFVSSLRTFIIETMATTSLST